MKKIAIIILHFNNKIDTLGCLKSLESISKNNFVINIYIVDNGSKEPFSADSSSYKVIRSELNLGFSEGNNIGIRYALKKEADYILLLNNDTIVHKSLLEELCKVAELNASNGVIVPKIFFAPGFEFHKDRYNKEQLGKVIWYAGGKMDWNNVIGYHRGVDEVDRGQYDKIEETEFATGNCMLIKKEVFEKVGFFDKRYFLYYEDGDFSIRVKKAEYKIMFVPTAKLWHKNAASAGGSGSNLQDYYITRNRMLFGMCYAQFKSKIALLRESIKIAAKGRYWQRRGILDFYLGKYNKGSYPI